MTTQQSAAPMKKMGEIQMPEVNSAQLARLDPSIPYIILLKENTTERVITDLVAFLGKCNVMAQVLVGDPKNFRMYASFPWNVAPQKIQADIHPLTLEPPSQIAEILRKNFISAIHDDAEAVEVLYQRIRANGINDSSNLTSLEAMVRTSILRFQVLDELFRISDPIQVKKRSTITEAAASSRDVVDTYNVSNVLEALVSFVRLDNKEEAFNSPVLQSLASKIAETGLTSDLETQVLKLQNSNTLMSGVKGALESMFPAIKATKTKATTKAPVKRSARKK